MILANLIRLMNNSFSSKVRVAENSKFDQTGVICVNLTQQNKKFKKDLHFNLTKIEHEYGEKERETHMTQNSYLYSLNGLNDCEICFQNIKHEIKEHNN